MAEFQRIPGSGGIDPSQYLDAWAPISSTVRNVTSQVSLDVDDGMKGPCAVNLHNAVTITQERPGKRVATLSAERMHEVCAALRFSLGCV
jgi:mRNA-degrading endonuclease toxin of MazEF toxin-antitoxin module